MGRGVQLGFLRWPRTSCCWAIGWGAVCGSLWASTLGLSPAEGTSCPWCLEGMSGTMGQAVHAEGMLAVTQAASWALPTQRRHGAGCPCTN